MKKNEIRLNTTLKNLIEEFIIENEPISSRIIYEKYMSNVSPATLRIDLNKLEQRGYIWQPHTSAGRTPTVKGFRKYIELIQEDLALYQYPRLDALRELLISNYKNTPLGLHYIMQILAGESDQLSFVAEPEISTGILSNLEVFNIGNNKLLFVVSLDSGMDKTVILQCDYDINDSQLKKLVKYVQEEYIGLRIYDIINKYLSDTTENNSEPTSLLTLFLKELHKALVEISGFFIHFDGNITFIEQPEFDSKENIMKFFNIIQRQDLLINMMQEHDSGEEFQVLMGDQLNDGLWHDFVLIFARYELFDIPGYLGIVSPLRNDYKKNIAMVRDVAKTITETTRKGTIVPKF
jgi:heat-inducible transcriptional repressor